MKPSPLLPLAMMLALACGAEPQSQATPPWKRICEQNAAAFDELRPGISEAHATSRLVTAGVPPPWASPEEVGSTEFQSPLRPSTVALASGATATIILYPVSAQGEGCPLKTGEVRFRPLVVQNGIVVAIDVNWFEGKQPKGDDPPPTVYKFMWHCFEGHGNRLWIAPRKGGSS